MKANPLVRPFLKWAGGKRQLLEEIKQYVPAKYNHYFEPFLGGGAVLFALQPSKAIVNDKNSELIHCYEVIRDSVEELIDCLGQYKNEEDYYYEVRDWDRLPNFNDLPKIKRASRIIFLNKTCYNGLFRVNSQGQFNVPFGRYKEPNFVDKVVLRAVSNYLKGNHIQFLNTDFADATTDAAKGDFLYFDPPYDPVSNTASFTGYDVNGFDRNEQYRLRALVDDIDRRGSKFLLSNASTEFTKSLYSGYKCAIVEVPRFINSNAQKRGKVDEILVRNYDRRTK